MLEYRIVFRSSSLKVSLFNELYDYINKTYKDKLKEWNTYHWWEKLYKTSPSDWKNDMLGLIRNLQFQDSYSDDDIEYIFDVLDKPYDDSMFIWVSPIYDEYEEQRSYDYV